MVGHNREPCHLERVCEALCCVAISHVDDLDELVELREGRRIARGHAKTRVVGLSSTTVLLARFVLSSAARSLPTLWSVKEVAA